MAVKVLKSEFHNEPSLNDFYRECAVMEKLRHPNIVQFMGACFDKPNYAIVLEFCANMSLFSLM